MTLINNKNKIISFNNNERLNKNVQFKLQIFYFKTYLQYIIYHKKLLYIFIFNQSKLIRFFLNKYNNKNILFFDYGVLKKLYKYNSFNIWFSNQLLLKKYKLKTTKKKIK